MLTQEMVKRRLSLMRGASEAADNPIVQIVSDGIGAKVVLSSKAMKSGADDGPEDASGPGLVRFDVASSRVCFEMSGAFKQMGEWLKEREDEAQRERAVTAGRS